jgi:hypothetical protein
MSPYPVASGIRFNDYLFSEPARLDGWVPPKFAGVFAILAADLNWAPRPFVPLYFGEFGNNAPRIHLPNAHPRLTLPAGAQVLFVCVLAMPFSTTTQRWAVRNQLVWAYNPEYQAEVHSEGADKLASKLHELEKKHEEQTTQLRLILASINKLFEPQPDPPRRHIGFLPQSAPAG